jgi:hypothetical protein
MISRGIVPNLIISQNVVDRVFKAAQSYIEDETGETMVGLVVDTNEPETMPTLYVLDCIAPDDTVIRRSHMFEQGDELQQDIFFWLLENWNAYQDIGRDMSGKVIKDEWKVDLKHLGDWHKQPGFMIQPSGGDWQTALRIMDDEENAFEFLLVPIVTLGHPSVTSDSGSQVNYFTRDLGDGTSLRMDWWYIHRDVRVFQPITPKIVPARELPDITPYPWHILKADLLDEELNLLEEDGKFLMSPSAIFWELDGDLPLEICFIVGRTGSNQVYLVVTDWDYPNTKPRIRLADFSQINPSQYIADVFADLLEISEEAPDPENFEWDPESSYIVDYIALIEREMGVRPDNAPMPWERDQLDETSIGVEIETDADDETANARASSADASADQADDDATQTEVETNEEETT